MTRNNKKKTEFHHANIKLIGVLSDASLWMEGGGKIQNKISYYR